MAKSMGFDEYEPCLKGSQQTFESPGCHLFRLALVCFLHRRGLSLGRTSESPPPSPVEPVQLDVMKTLLQTHWLDLGSLNMGVALVMLFIIAIAFDRITLVVCGYVKS